MSYGGCYGVGTVGSPVYGGGCVGGVVTQGAPVVGGPSKMVTNPGKMEKKENPLNPGNGGDNNQISTGPSKAEATIIVNLPADAKLTVDGVVTKSKTARRRLVTPSLPTSRTFHYTMQAEIVRDGKPVTQQQKVTVRGGEQTTVNFTFYNNIVASR
ncbi:MAG: TIGR03000 domain-containing protein [Gemmataceae bacterium]